MANTFTRRQLLRIPAIEGEKENAASEAELQPLPGKMQVWVTDGTRRHAAMAPVGWTPARGSTASDTILLDSSRKHQRMLGFGAAFSEAACYTFRQLSPAARAELFHTLFHPSEMGLNVCRICMGSADSATKVYNYDEGTVDPDLERFSIAHDQEYILPVLREALGINGELFLFASPWSPPGWMKSNGSMLGGCMEHTYMPSYANYFLKFLRAYERENIPVQAVTIQNEVDADQDGRQPACAWPQDYEADFLTMHLGPLFERSGIQTKIWIIDHNYNLWGRAMGELETPDVRKYTNAVAWHGYAGEPEWIGRVQDAYPEVEMYWTEGGPDYRAAGYLTEWAKWGQTFTRILRNCCRSITAWNFATDENGRPYVGSDPSGVGGAMMVNSQTKQISYSGMYWALGHFSRFVRRHAHRIDSQGLGTDLAHCAFQNPDGSLVVVLTNSGNGRSCEVRLGDESAHLTLTANSMTTLTFPSVPR